MAAYIYIYKEWHYQSTSHKRLVAYLSKAHICSGVIVCEESNHSSLYFLEREERKECQIRVKTICFQHHQHVIANSVIQHNISKYMCSCQIIMWSECLTFCANSCVPRITSTGGFNWVRTNSTMASTDLWPLYSFLATCIHTHIMIIQIAKSSKFNSPIHVWLALAWDTWLCGMDCYTMALNLCIVLCVHDVCVCVCVRLCK